MTPRYKKSIKSDAMQKTRQLLLEAAAEEFARNGYDKANINRIAESAGFSIGTVYNYFPSKRGLMFSFIDETAQKHVDYMIDQVKLEENPSRQIITFFNAGFAFVEMNITPMKAILNALNGPNEEYKERLYQAYLHLFQLLSEDVIPEGIASGDFRQVDPLTTSRLIMQIYLGTSSQLSPEGKPWIDHTQVADFVLHSLKCGIKEHRDE
jgi:AcrR family transcriptional regulator